MSQRIPPWRVPMGFACFGPAAKVTVARPSPISFASNPIRVIIYLTYPANLGSNFFPILGRGVSDHARIKIQQQPNSRIAARVLESLQPARNGAAANRIDR